MGIERDSSEAISWTRYMPECPREYNKLQCSSYPVIGRERECEVEGQGKTEINDLDRPDSLVQVSDSEHPDS